MILVRVCHRSILRLAFVALSTAGVSGRGPRSAPDLFTGALAVALSFLPICSHLQHANHTYSLCLVASQMLLTPGPYTFLCCISRAAKCSLVSSLCRYLSISVTGQLPLSPAVAIGAWRSDTGQMLSVRCLPKALHLSLSMTAKHISPLSPLQKSASH